MKVTCNWLKEFVDFDLSPVELADLLTMLGLEVEGIQQIGHGMDDVVVARVLEKGQHPNADKLSLCRVDNGTEILSVVCGAQNFQQGDTVVLAQIGAQLPGDFRIKRSKIRGEESFGMLCSEKELALAEESAGIMVLPAGLTLGTPIFEALGVKDTVLEVGLTPNRADCLSVMGIAREIAAKLGTRMKYPTVSVPEGGEATDRFVTVDILDPEGCPRYGARYVSGCRIAPSPPWLVSRLQAVGVRSINNVVDVTNLILMEMGHPLHAFDYRQVAGGRIVVRRAHDRELFRTLDGQERTLLATDLVICDQDRPVALAGIMGGENSEISDDTTTILLESAFFDPPTIRRTSKRLGLHTESSHRFERGADIEMVPLALDRAATLIAQLAGGTVAAGRVDNYPAPRKPTYIPFRPDRANAILGLSLSADEMANLFRNLEFVVETGSDGLLVSAPSYRVDIEREIDLIEEICRLNGFDKVPATMPRAEVFSDRPSRHQALERKVRDYFITSGLHEIISFSFIGPDAADRLLLRQEDPRRTTIALCNPLAEEQSVMRTMLLPGLLETLARNLNFRSFDLGLLEMRRVYLPNPASDMPHEPIVCAGVLTGRRMPSGWSQPSDAADFFDIKGILEGLFEELRIEGVVWKAGDAEPFQHPGKSARIFVDGEQLGTLGELHPTVLENFGIDLPVYHFEIAFEMLVRMSRVLTSVVAPSRFPDVQRDLALLVPEEVPSQDVLDSIQGQKVKELEGLEVFDHYTGSHVPQGMKSIAVRLRYRLSDRTLTDDEVNRIHGRLVDSLCRRMPVTIR